MKYLLGSLLITVLAGGVMTAGIAALFFGCNGVVDVPSLRWIDYPWPECPVVVSYLKENSGYPDDLEILKWIDRIHHDKEYSGLANGYVPTDETIIKVKIRGKNGLGGKVVNVYQITVLKGRVAYCTQSSE